MSNPVETKKKAATGDALGVLLVLVATVSFSTEGVAAKIAYREGAGVITTLALRYAVAALVLWTGLVLCKRPWRLTRNQLLAVTLLALGTQAVTVLCLFYAFKYIPAAMAILFLYFYPTVVTLLAYFLLKEPLTWRKITALVLTLAGCAVILGQPVHGLDPRGVVLALVAALTNALFLVGSTRLLADIPVPVYTSYMTAIIAVFFLAVGQAGGQLDLSLSPAAWQAIVFLGVVCTVVALACMLRGVELIGASRTAIISTFEPVATALLGFWLLQETLSGRQLLGGALVILGVLLQRNE